MREVAVFHNRCGRRTIIDRCRCSHCLYPGLQAAIDKTVAGIHEAFKDTRKVRARRSSDQGGE
jgi:hypothetical protein